MGCSSLERIWEWLWKGKGAEPTELQCEGKANVVFGCAGSSTTSGAQEVSVPLLSMGETSAAGKLALGSGSREGMDQLESIQGELQES